MNDNCEKWLSNLKDQTVCVSATGAYPEQGCASVELLFANGSRLRADYWRVVEDGKAGRSSFDHQQQYGLPKPIDAIEYLKEQLQEKSLTGAHLEKRTGDIVFQFAGGVEFQVFNFTGYEVWQITFPDGTGDYSNYAK